MRNVSYQNLISRTEVSARFGPRLGRLNVTDWKTEEAKGSGSEICVIEAPGFLTSTSRGIIPHLTHDHIEQSDAVNSVLIPIESFLEHTPPLPTINGHNTLRELSGLKSDRNIILMSLRDPCDAREMPPNGKKFVNAWCVRGVRKIEPNQYLSLLQACDPDIAFALSDIPFTPPPFSQKRIEKSLERSRAWLAALIRPGNDISTAPKSPYKHHSLNLIVHMCGDINERAREAFSVSLRETLFGKEAEQIAPFNCLDEAVLGYAFDLVPLRTSIIAHLAQVPILDEGSLPANRRTVDTKFLTQPRSDEILPIAISLIQSSLLPLPPEKPRFVTGTASPHEVLKLVRDIGIDILDAGWAQKAADWGIALDFTFPVPDEHNPRQDVVNGLRDLGHNLYSQRYARDFTRFASCLSEGSSARDTHPTCPCIACSPRGAPIQPLIHASADLKFSIHPEKKKNAPPHTRAYLHHLLHTHEMSAHTLLAAHNLAVADTFFASMRRYLSDNTGDDAKSFSKEVDHFCETYDGSLRIFAEAKRDWITVDYARGKGRLAREKTKQNEELLVTKMGLEDEADELGA